MHLKKFVSPLVAVVAATFVLSGPSRAAMPVDAGASTADNGLVVQVAKKKKRMTRQQELDRSIDSGTVPSRYRANVPREYQQYVPFSKQ